MTRGDLAHLSLGPIAEACDRFGCRISVYRARRDDPWAVMHDARGRLRTDGMSPIVATTLRPECAEALSEDGIDRVRAFQSQQHESLGKGES